MVHSKQPGLDRMLEMSAFLCGLDIWQQLTQTQHIQSVSSLFYRSLQSMLAMSTQIALSTMVMRMHWRSSQNIFVCYVFKDLICSR